MRAYRNREEITLRLTHGDLTCSDVLMGPAQVVKRLQKSKNQGKGMQIKISQSNIQKQLLPLLGKHWVPLPLQEQLVKESVKS